MLKMILCLDKNNGLGKNNSLPWNIKEELLHFKNETINKTVIMGYNTYVSLNNKLLPNRKNIIFSNKKDLKIKNAIVTNSIEYILKLSKKKDVYIIGGKQIYETFFRYCNEIILSRLNKSYNCDVIYNLNTSKLILKKAKKYNDFTVYYYKNFVEKMLDGIKVREKIFEILLNDKNLIIEKYKKLPKLSIIQVGNDDASNVYIRNKILFAKRLGVDAELIKLPSKTQSDELYDVISKLNNDKNVNGILVQSPLPKHLDMNDVAKWIDPMKDVDCFNPINLGFLFRGELNKINCLPCTAEGVIELLKNYNIKLEGKNIVVIGRSNIVSKPLAMLLIYENATVTIIHSKTKNINIFLKRADIICSAASNNKLINAKNIKNNAIVVDISMNRDENNNLCGDADFINVINKVRYISPVPGGVGPLTITILFKNLLRLFKAQHQNK